MKNLSAQSYKLGSNQYVMKKKLHPVLDAFTYYEGNPRFIRAKTFLNCVAIVLFLALPVSICWYSKTLTKAYAEIPGIQVMPKVTPFVQDPTTEQQQIMAYIDEVFGEDKGKAYKVLSCENAKLNPKAVNTAGNYPAGSRDIGVFQVNEYWQKTQGKFLFNWKINVEIAHQLFEENGKSFKLWSCGRKLGV